MKKIIFIALFSISILLHPGAIDSIDTVTHMFLAQKIIGDHEISFTEYEDRIHMPLAYKAENNRYYPNYNFGLSFFMMPGWLLSIGLRDFLNVPIPYFPYETDVIYMYYLFVLNSICAGVIGTTIFEFVKLLTNPDRKTEMILGISVILTFFSTNLFAYAHHITPIYFYIAAITISLYYLTRYLLKSDATDLFSFSILFALSASLYNTSFIFFIPPILAMFMWDLWKVKKISGRPYISRVARFSLYLLPAICVQLGWNFVRFGDPFNTGYLNSTVVYIINATNILKNIYGLTFSPSNGFFIYNPLMFVTLMYVGWKLLKHESKYSSVYVLFTTGLALFIAHYSLVRFWHGDSTYGPRYITPWIPLGLVLFHVMLTEILKMKKLTQFLIAVLISANIAIGTLIQIPAILIPSYFFPHIMTQDCQSYDRYFFAFDCFRAEVGLRHILNTRISTTRSAVAYDQYKSFFIAEVSFPLRLGYTEMYPASMKLPSKVYFIPTAEMLHTESPATISFRHAWSDTDRLKSATYVFSINGIPQGIHESRSIDWQTAEFSIDPSVLKASKYNTLDIVITDFTLNENFVLPEDPPYMYPDISINSIVLNNIGLNMRNYRTLMNDPLFDSKSDWKTYDYEPHDRMYLFAYNQLLDLGIIRLLLYKNVTGY